MNSNPTFAKVYCLDATEFSQTWLWEANATTEIELRGCDVSPVDDTVYVTGEKGQRRRSEKRSMANKNCTRKALRRKEKALTCFFSFVCWDVFVHTCGGDVAGSWSGLWMGTGVTVGGKDRVLAAVSRYHSRS